MSIMFPYPVKFVSTDGTEFDVRVTKPNKRSWYISLLDKNGGVVKTIKVSKTSIKLRYKNQKGGLSNGIEILQQIVRERNKSQKPNTSFRQTGS